MAEPAATTAALSAMDLYLYDTVGLLHRPAVLSADEVKGFVDYFARVPPDCAIAATTTERWEDLPRRDAAFEGFMRRPAVLDIVRGLINQPLRVVESYAHRSGQGSFLYLHNGGTQDQLYPDGTRASKHMAYRCEYHDGRLYTTYLKAICYLTDIGEDDGPFCYVEGSHKANYAFPWPHRAMERPELLANMGFGTLRSVPVKAGDVIFLNEALLHGARPKRSATPRILMSFSYCPAFMSDWRPLERDPGDLAKAGYYDLDDEVEFFA